MWCLLCLEVKPIVFVDIVVASRRSVRVVVVVGRRRRRRRRRTRKRRRFLLLLLLEKRVRGASKTIQSRELIDWIETWKTNQNDPEFLAKQNVERQKRRDKILENARSFEYVFVHDFASGTKPDDAFAHMFLKDELWEVTNRSVRARFERSRIDFRSRPCYRKRSKRDRRRAARSR